MMVPQARFYLTLIHFIRKRDKLYLTFLLLNMNTRSVSLYIPHYFITSTPIYRENPNLHKKGPSDPNFGQMAKRPHSFTKIIDNIGLLEVNHG